MHCSRLPPRRWIKPGSRKRTQGADGISRPQRDTSCQSGAGGFQVWSSSQFATRPSSAHSRPLLSRGDAYSGLPGLGGSLLRCATVVRPAERNPPSPVSGRVAFAFTRGNVLFARHDKNFGTDSPWLVCSPVYASPRPLPSTPQGWLSAGGGFTLPPRSRTGRVAYSWFLSLSRAWILHDPFCLVAPPPILPHELTTVGLPTQIASSFIQGSKVSDLPHLAARSGTMVKPRM